MKIQLKVGELRYQADLSTGLSLAITLQPNGAQPSHFGAPACTSQTLEGGGFIGDTRRGGSCNVQQITLVPHCNGTHTESVAHIIDEAFPVYQALERSHFVTALVTVEPQRAAALNDDYAPGFDPDNFVVSRAQLQQALAPFESMPIEGLIIRTLPNALEKCHTVYGDDNYPVYLSGDAMRFVVEHKIRHLLVDFPSVDKMYDEGMLSNHRIFWQVSPGENRLNAASQPYKTITEMAYAADAISDGLYLCDLQIPMLDGDAVPSRPQLFPLELL